MIERAEHVHSFFSVKTMDSMVSTGKTVLSLAEGTLACGKLMDLLSVRTEAKKLRKAVKAVMAEVQTNKLHVPSALHTRATLAMQMALQD